MLCSFREMLMVPCEHQTHDTADSENHVLHDTVLGNTHIARIVRFFLQDVTNHALQKLQALTVILQRI